MGFIALRHVGSSQIRDRTHVSCTGRQIFYSWATREAVKPLWKEVFRARFPRHLLDCSHYPFFVYWALISTLSTPFHGHQGNSNYQRHWFQMFMCSVTTLEGVFPLQEAPGGLSAWLPSLSTLPPEHDHLKNVFPTPLHYVLWWCAGSQAHGPIELEPHLYVARDFQLCDFL